MNFMLRPQPAFPLGQVLTTRYPRPLKGLLSFSAEARNISSRRTLKSTRPAKRPFIPLPTTLPEAPAYPCPHLKNLSPLEPLFFRRWTICKIITHRRMVQGLKKTFILERYRDSIGFFNDVMGLPGICAQEKVNPFHVMEGSGTNTMMCLASPTPRRF